MLRVEDLHTLPYDTARRIQLERLESRVRKEIPDTLLLVEHPSIVTLGRGTLPENLRDPHRFPVVTTERGGDATLHGPGQIVGYLIRWLEEGRRDLHAHLRLLEEILIRSLATLGVEGSRREGLTGVWVSNRKIASLGVACRSWCTWHGFALNVSIPLEHFEVINPCGLDSGVMTSLMVELEAAEELEKKSQGEVAAMELVKQVLGDQARSLLGGQNPV